MWKRWIRGGLLVLSIIFTSFLLYLLMTRTESVSSSNLAKPAILDRADAGIDQFTFMQSRGGAVQWEVRAQRARVFETENRAILDQVQVTLYGTIDTVKRNFVLARHTGLIAIQLEGGYTVYTNHLAWNDASREITTGDPVTLSGNGLEVTGLGLVGKLDKEEFQVLQDVHVEIVQ